MLTTIPNLLTILRVLLIPLVVVFFYLPIENAAIISSLCFLLAGITDWLDGYLARKLQQTSKFGAFLDPVADKLLVAVTLVLIVDKFSVLWVTIPAAIVISREILISALREWMAEVGSRASVAVSQIGKFKTALQMAAIVVLLYAQSELSLAWLGIVLLWLATLLTLWSMTLYLKAAKQDLLD